MPIKNMAIFEKINIVLKINLIEWGGGDLEGGDNVALCKSLDIIITEKLNQTNIHYYVIFMQY